MNAVLPLERLCFDNIGELEVYLSASKAIEFGQYQLFTGADFTTVKLGELGDKMKKVTEDLKDRYEKRYAGLNAVPEAERPALLWTPAPYTQNGLKIEHTHDTMFFDNIISSQQEDSGLAIDVHSANYQYAAAYAKAFAELAKKYSKPDATDDFIVFAGQVTMQTECRVVAENDAIFRGIAFEKGDGNPNPDYNFEIHPIEHYGTVAKTYMLFTVSSDDLGCTFATLDDSSLKQPYKDHFLTDNLHSGIELTDKSFMFMFAALAEAESGIHFNYEQLHKLGLITEYACEILSKAQERAMLAEPHSRLPYKDLFTDALNFEILTGSFRENSQELISEAIDLFPEGKSVGYFALDGGGLLNPALLLDMARADQLVENPELRPDDISEFFSKITGTIYSFDGDCTAVPRSDVIYTVRIDAEAVDGYESGVNNLDRYKHPEDYVRYKKYEKEIE